MHRTMEKTIKTLLNGYEVPVALSDARDGSIVFLNDAARRHFNFSRGSEAPAPTRLKDLFSSRRVVRQTVVWERNQQRFEISEEKLEIEGKKYIRSVIKPLDSEETINLLEMQKEMAQLLVHRFHSPLNGVAGFAELLAETQLNERQQKYVEAIQTGLADFKNILSSIHDLAEDIEVQPASVNVEQFSRDLLEHYPPGTRRKIELLIDAGVVQLQTDYVLLQKIIHELLDNALDFGSPDHEKIRLHFREDNIIRVTSFGAPIPQTFVKKMFCPFFSRKARGVGLGLSKSMYYAHALGYNIILSENSAAGGVSFDIVLD